MCHLVFLQLMCLCASVITLLKLVGFSCVIMWICNMSEQVHITTRCRVSLVARLERQIYWATKVFIPDTNRISITNTFKLVINKRTRGQSCLWRQAEDRWHSWGTSLVCLFLGRTRSLWACSIMKATMLALIWCWARSTSWLSFLGKRRCVENMV